jgi:cytochrome c peroxidase
MRIGAIFALIFGAMPVAAADLPAPVNESDYQPVNLEEAKLGQLLFYDRILSGNRNIACSTCHHPRFSTSDGLSLGIGEGGIELGPQRHPDPADYPEQRIPRNATALFNLGAHEFKALFHDGRIETDPSRPSGLRTPLEDEMVAGFASILSAQTMFPVLSPDEMAGHYSENEVSRAVREGLITGEDGAWSLISRRVAALPEYQAMFAAVYPEIAAGRKIGFTDISNAIAAFVAFEWRSDESPFDAYLRGQGQLPVQALAGMELFYGSAGCSSCHSGPFLTDQSFHAMGEPQIGPGKAERFESHSRDVGRMRVTNNPEDAYSFRTPSLRNVSETGPWGHAGAWSDLTAFLLHHSNPGEGLATFDRTEPVLPAMAVAKPDWVVLDSPEEFGAITAAAAESLYSLNKTEAEEIRAFLLALKDPVALAGRLGIPASVPSGLPVDR